MQLLVLMLKKFVLQQGQVESLIKHLAIVDHVRVARNALMTAEVAVMRQILTIHVLDDLLV